MKVFFYSKGNNKQPVKDFILKLGTKNSAKVFGALESLEICGLNDIRLNYKFIKDKLWELKIQIKDGSIRIFYVIIEEEIMVLLHAFKKKTQKTPKKELEIAFLRAKEVLENAN